MVSQANFDTRLKKKKKKLNFYNKHNNKYAIFPRTFYPKLLHLKFINSHLLNPVKILKAINFKM